jgi:hypothetical protein
LLLDFWHKTIFSKAIFGFVKIWLVTLEYD